MVRVFFAVIFTLSLQVQAATVETVDAIPNGARDHYNGFEGMANSGPVYVEDNIRVEQINGDLNDITLGYSKVGFEGSQSWYPNGGDSGYTRITLDDGGAIQALGLMRGSGNSSHADLLYELWNNGAVVQSGSVFHQGDPALYIGFTGGGFDEVRLRDGNAPTSVDDGSHNAMVIDVVEAIAGGPVVAAAPGSVQAVPTMSAYALFLLSSLLGLVGLTRMRKAKSA